jgi:hypothetical protein
MRKGGGRRTDDEAVPNPRTSDAVGARPVVRAGMRSSDHASRRARLSAPRTDRQRPPTASAILGSSTLGLARTSCPIGFSIDGLILICRSAASAAALSLIQAEVKHCTASMKAECAVLYIGRASAVMVASSSLLIWVTSAAIDARVASALISRLLHPLRTPSASAMIEASRARMHGGSPVQINRTHPRAKPGAKRNRICHAQGVSQLFPSRS